MVRVEILRAVNWTRGKRDVVALMPGQVVEVPDAVAGSMIDMGLARRAPLPPSLPAAMPAAERHKRSLGAVLDHSMGVGYGRDEVLGRGRPCAR
jgi:hypothetical protein